MKHQKYIELDFENGQRWHIPLNFIAEHRTRFYAQKDGFSANSEEWKEEMSFVMDDDFEGIDWLSNNMNWEDVENVATLVGVEDFDIQDEFVNCEKEIITK